MSNENPNPLCAGKTSVKGAKRGGRIALALTALALLCGSLAGTAHGAGVWEDVWAQIRPLLSDPGTINNPDNPVHWTKLKNVPAGLADGLDNGVDRAGFGLTKNVYPNLEFAVDLTKVQRRVTGSCPGGQAVQSIAENGSVTCYVGPRAFSSSSTNTGIICNDWCVEGAITLQPGTYAVTAKIVVEQHGADVDRLRVVCQLRTPAGSLFDESETNSAVSPDSLQWPIPTTLPLQGVVTLHEQGNVSLTCRDNNLGDVEGRMMKLMAVSVS
jgi:hypothetical protein